MKSPELNAKYPADKPIAHKVNVTELSEHAEVPKSKKAKTKKSKDVKAVTKKNLRTMRKSRNSHPLRTHVRIVKYGSSGFSRNIWLSSAATVVMIVTLVILFVTIVASVILTNTAEMMKDKIDITIYIKPNTTQEVYTQLSDIMKQDPNVRSVETTTSEEEYNKFRTEKSESSEISNVLDEEMQDILISKMPGTMRIKVYNVDDLSSIKMTVQNNEVFKASLDPDKDPTYDVNQVEIATITNWAHIARNAGLGLAIVFLVISILIIFSTIRMAIFSRREEIYMMKLVGAEKRFIRGPFLVEAEICGIIAGLVAATISFVGFMALAPKLESYGINVDVISDILQSNKILLVYLAFVAVGLIISNLSARLAISKYLHKT